MFRTALPSPLAALGLVGLLPLLLLGLVPTSGAAGSTSTAAKSGLSIGGLLDKNALPTTGQDWQSMSRGGLEFQPNHFADEDEETANFLRTARDRMLYGTEASVPSGEYAKQFINGDETYYSEYSQAWRLLGLYIDCNAPVGDQSDCDGDDGHDNGDDDGATQGPCQRYLMWAAYIDLDYQGGGIGEYQYFDRHSDSWSTDSCVAENGRCEKMDCHLKDTNFKLLGFFKEPNYHSWMEQLFKHEGVCVWTADEYSLMQTDRELWPCGCTDTYQVDENGAALYYDTKPMSEGRISLGLYTDDRCSQDYDGDLDAAEVLAAFVSSGYGNGDNHNDNDEDGGSVASLAQQLEDWNDAFDIFKKCQPCVAYDLSYDPADTSNQDEDEHRDEDGNQFDCHDDAGYNNVNQCMKFRTKTEMLTADFRDIQLASEQGTIVEVEVLGVTYGSGGFGRRGYFDQAFTMTGEHEVSRSSMAVFCVSLILLFVGFFFFVLAKKHEKLQSSMEEPLVSNGGVVA